MGTRIEIRTQTIHFPDLRDGGQILDSVTTCAKKLQIKLVEIITKAPPISGEEDFNIRIKGKVPNGVIEIVPPTTYDKGFIGGKPYSEMAMRLVAKLPIPDETENLLKSFFECLQNKPKE
jgi:hypothetical protein